MKKENCMWQAEWDFTGEEVTYWNQTLITCINRMSANIHQATLIGGANRIEIHSRLFGLIETLEYYRKETGLISGRYKVIINDHLNEDEVFIYIEEHKLTTAGCITILNYQTLVV